MSIRQRIKSLMRRAGWDLGRYDPHADAPAFRAALLEELAIAAVLDVGANAGQYGQQIRALGYAGRIVSFEPLMAARAELMVVAEGDSAWQVLPYALGDRPGTAQINVAGNSWSSSLLPMLDAHRQAAPESAYVGVQEVVVRTLDDVAPEVCAAGEQLFLKVDTQGYTLAVLRGADATLARVAGLQVELSLVPLYGGEPLIGEVLTFLQNRGFRLVFVEPEFADKRGYQLQVNGLFVRQ